jgi:ubiquinone biosynthesis monooxygenase Coq7
MRAINNMTQLQEKTHNESCGELTVMFDGGCPLCRREIGLYQSLAPLQPVAWLDVSKETAGLSAADQARYMARFHVRLQDGRVLSGAAAFVALWDAMPGWRWLARIGQLPGVTWLMELAYRGFLKVRPHLQRWARRAESATQK